MRGVTMLHDIAQLASLAADAYPRIVKALDDAGVPTVMRAQVLAYILQVIGSDDNHVEFLQ